ncbi:MAG TPA: DoxX-like family protein [Chitinophagaceae bacterium]|mgnify:CR=1 FL=1|nr:DoxX-like family protein [Chitinophagaceae bacterium]
MEPSTTAKIINYFIATVWLVNGLFCKILNLVPRHQEIVANILGQEHSRFLTIAIGISEVLMAVWILSGIRSRLNTILQIVVIAVMNTLEFILVPGLLLWGRFNSLFALLLILVIYYHEFHLKPKITPHS